MSEELIRELQVKIESQAQEIAALREAQDIHWRKRGELMDEVVELREEIANPRKDNNTLKERIQWSHEHKDPMIAALQRTVVDLADLVQHIGGADEYEADCALFNHAATIAACRKALCVEEVK